jgi:Domain of unknown function (DUF4249)
MKTLYIYLILAISTLFISCEDVVDVDLKNDTPKLVIDASIKWEKGSIGNNQTIKLTTTGDYFNNTVPVASGATVTIVDSDATIFNFIETPGTGNYVCTTFAPVINKTYTLTVNYAGQTYTATDKLYEVPTVISVEQNSGIIDPNDIEVRFKFQDNANEENFYLDEYIVPFAPTPLYVAFDDVYTNGNITSSFYFSNDFEVGDNVKYTLQGISERYFNYMSKLISISGGSSNGPFSTPPASVRGNMININNEDNYPLGYFRLSEIEVRNYVIQ